MTRAKFQSAVDRHLKTVGFKSGSYVWAGSDLVLNINGTLRKIGFKARPSKDVLGFTLGRLSGLAEGLSLNVHRTNGAHLNGSASLSHAVSA